MTAPEAVMLFFIMTSVPQMPCVESVKSTTNNQAPLALTSLGIVSGLVDLEHWDLLWLRILVVVGVAAHVLWLLVEQRDHMVLHTVMTGPLWLGSQLDHLKSTLAPARAFAIMPGFVGLARQVTS